jgi:hypoxanthine phosphoribosyltransferase
MSTSAQACAPIIIADDHKYSVDDFCIPPHYDGAVGEIMIPYGLVQDRIEKLAQILLEDYKDSVPHLLCTLKGAHEFFADLLKAMRQRNAYKGSKTAAFTFDFMRAKSYEGTGSSGEVKMSGLDLAELAGRDVIVVEDIVDTGTTMLALLPALEAHGPKSVKVVSLLEKRTERSKGYKADYVGFSIPDKFIVGYAVDYNDHFRDMPHICVMTPEGVERFKEEHK